MRILCADDREIDRLLIRQNLRRSNLQAELFEASTCTEALSAIQDRQFDCLLLDYAFPDGTGLDLLREIEAREIPLPVIVLSGAGDERLAVELMKSGAMDYLPKTDVTPLLLSRTIQAAVSRHQREQSRKAQSAAEKYARILQAQKAEMERHAEAIQESRHLLAASINTMREGYLLAASINAMREGYLLQDSDGAVLRMNRSAEQILGLDAEECIGRADGFRGCHWVREDGAEIPAAEHPTAITLATGLPQFDVPIGLVRRDGRLVRLSIGCAPLFRPDEFTPYATVTTFNDVTSQHKAEMAEKRAQELTEHLLRLSTALSGAVTTTEAAEVVLQAVVAIFHAKDAFLARPGAEGDASGVVPVASAGTPACPSGESPELSPVLLAAIRDRRLIVRFQDAPPGPQADRAGQQALAAVPLLAGEHVVGALGLRCPSEQCENAAQQTFLWTLAGQCALALERVRLFDAAQERADRDPLTNLLNHRSFHKRLEEEALRVTRERTSLAVVMLDLDNFRFFNDVYGHATGDEVLRMVAERLESVCKPGDVISRFGGDEFALLLRGTDGLSPRQIETRILAAVDGLSYQSKAQDDAIPIRLSAGAAVFRHTDIEWHGVVKDADARLHRKKMGEEIDGEAQSVRSVALHDVAGFSMLDALVTAVDNKDHYTLRHSNDVMCYSLAIARELGLGREELRAISLGALLHDVGKIGVPDAILRKPGRLTAEEFEAVKQHPQMGAMIVATVPELESTLDAIRYHHERWDGHGYPAGLQGEQIPLVARIMAVADAYSAMTSDRPYRKGMDRSLALSILERGAGTQWDARCVAAFVRAMIPAVETL